MVAISGAFCLDQAKIRPGAGALDPRFSLVGGLSGWWTGYVRAGFLGAKNGLFWALDATFWALDGRVGGRLSVRPRA